MRLREKGGALSKSGNIMDIKNFVEKIAEQYDESEEIVFSPDTHFKELEEYSSLTALTIIAMVDEEYDVTLRGDEIRGCTTIEDLYKVVESKVNA